MKNKIIIALIGIAMLTAGVAIGICVSPNFKKNSEVENVNLEEYIGYWYDEDKSSGYEMNELSIKKVENNAVTFDYNMAMLCGEKDIKVEINENKGEFSTEQSKGTIKFEKGYIQLSVKNVNYQQTFEKKFEYKESNRRILKIYVGEWYDEGKLNNIKINSIKDNKINFNFGIHRIVGFENLTALLNQDTMIAEFNTNNTNMGDFWKGIYGNIRFENGKITLEITKSECAYVQPTTYTYTIGDVQ